MSTLDSALRILKTLSPDRPILSVSEMSDELGLPKSTISRVLKTLSESGLLDRDEATRKYSAGPLSLQLGGLYLAQNSLLELVDKSLGKLVEEFGFTGYVGVLDGIDVVIVRQWSGRYPLRYVLDVGTRLRAHESALGLALLSAQDDEAIEGILGQAGLSKSDPEASRIMERAVQVRSQHWAEVACEAVPGITAIGCAINADSGVALSLSFPDAAADLALRSHMATKMVDAAKSIKELLQLPLRLSKSRSVRQ